jgi:medium-chain acyl-[acyl-carrier-protein] hydrolase
MAPLVEALATAIEPYLVEPYAFFGHSMGAAVAFELARLLRRRGKAGPLMLFASAARAPQFRRNHVPPAEPTDDQLLSELRQLEGTPRELLDDPLAIRAILPALRADTSLYRHYSYTEEPALACPIRAWGGARDANICREHLEGWAEQTASSFAVQVFEGGHFFLQTAKDEVLARLARELRPLYCPNRD